MKFGHIGIKILDLKKTMPFYLEVLQAKLIKEYHYPASHLIFMEIGGTIIELILKPENEPRTVGPIEHIAFKVDSLQEEMKRLDGLGVKYTQPRVVGNAEILFFDGPNNERFEFVAKLQQV